MIDKKPYVTGLFDEREKITSEITARLNLKTSNNVSLENERLKIKSFRNRDRPNYFI